MTGEAVMTGPALVTGPQGLADRIAEGLRRRGRAVRRSELDDVSRAGVGNAVDAAVAALGGLALAVHVHGCDDRPEEVEGMALERWVAGAEDEMARAFHLVQALHPHLQGGGRLVAVVPTFAMAGAPGFAPAAASAEGVRILVKSVAKQWGSIGVTANCVAVDAQLVLGGELGREVSRGVALAEPALGSSGDGEADIAPLIEAVTGERAHFLTGATLVADGGVWMVTP